MAEFDAERATRQQFLDGLLRAFAGGSGDGYGWHFTEITERQAEYIVRLETPRALIGWSETQPHIEGPHKVTLVVSSLSDSQHALRRVHEVYTAKQDTRRELANRLMEYTRQLGQAYADDPDPKPGDRPFRSDLDRLRRLRANVIADLRAMVDDLRDDG